MNQMLKVAREHRLFHLLIKVILIVAAGWCAFLLRFEFEIPPFYGPHLRLALVVWVGVKVVVFRFHRLHRRAWKFFSVDDVVRLVRANMIGSIVSLVVLYGLAPRGFPRSIPILDLILCSLFLGICSHSSSLGLLLSSIH